MARRKATPPAEETPAAVLDTASASGGEDAAPGAEGAAPVRRRRRRRANLGGPAETATMVESLLRTRQNSGATQQEIELVVGWARGVRGEGQALTEAMKRPTRQRQEKLGDRLAQQEMNLVLLQGVLDGKIGLDVKDGQIVFLTGGGSAAGGAPSAGEPVAAAAE
jgi:hypothetical protein